jgi:TusA-related sulfurtransferase
MSNNQVVLNLIGVKCPDFGQSLRSFFRKADAGTMVLVKSSAHNATRDITALCEYGGHTLIASRSEVFDTKTIFEFIVERGA